MPRPHPELETLESRRLLAVTVVNGVISGTPGDDVIVISRRGRNGHRVTVNGESRGFKTPKFRLIRAGAGNDRIAANADTPFSFDDDIVYSIDAGDGDDTVKSTTAVDSILGGNGNDRIAAGPAHNEVFGGAGNDRLRGGGGQDMIDGGDGDDTLYGDDGNDRLAGDTQDADAAAGADYLSGGDGTDEVSYSGRTANLRLSINDEPDDGGEGERDNIRTDVENLIGGAGHDYIVGSERANSLHGYLGVDTIFGLGGDDFIFGEGGIVNTETVLTANFLYGGDGHDLFNISGPGTRAYGEAGDDRFYLGSDTRLYGGSGNDSFYTRNGESDTIDGGDGDDFAIIDDFGDSHRSIERGIRPR